MNTETAKAFVALRAEGKREIYFLQTGGRDFLFRPLLFSEYELVCDMEKHMDGVFINDTILRLTVLYTDWPGGVELFLENSKAISADSMAEAVIKYSKFQDSQAFIKLVHEKRVEANELDNIMQTYVCSVFKVTPEEFEFMTLEEQVNLFTKAETVIGAPIEVERILSDDPEEAQAPPVPPGMDSVEFLTSKEAADLPKF